MSSIPLPKCSEPVILPNPCSEEEQGGIGLKWHHLHGNRKTFPEKPPVSWSIRKMAVENVWKYRKCTGKGVRVAVLDTGVDSSHVDIKIVSSADFTGSNHGTTDMNGHGTHCAGIVGSKNRKYVVGVAPGCSLMAGKVIGDDGMGDIRDIDRGIEWAIGNKADVISMSLGGDGPTVKEFASKISRAISKGVIVVVAAGNSGPYPHTVEAPGNFLQCVTVGAVDCSNRIARFSSRGTQIDVVAPGVDIQSTYSGGRYAKLSGTSMATPFVAGVAALFVERCKDVGMRHTQTIFETLVKLTARDLGRRGFDTSFGAGLIDIHALLNRVVSISSPNIKSHPNSLVVSDETKTTQ